MTPLEYFRLFAPGLSEVDDATVGQWLTIAASLTETGCLDSERVAMAEALYAAHLLALSLEASSGNGTLASGALTREREGDLEREYSAIRGNVSWLGKTIYGQQYLDVTRGCFGAAILTRGWAPL